MPVFWLGALLLVLAIAGVVPGLVALVVFGLGFLLYLRLGTPRGPEVEVDVPVAGRWRTVNSPGDKVPSHGLHAYGQTYAVGGGIGYASAMSFLYFFVLILLLGIVFFLLRSRARKVS